MGMCNLLTLPLRAVRNKLKGFLEGNNFLWNSERLKVLHSSLWYMFWFEWNPSLSCSLHQISKVLSLFCAAKFAWAGCVVWPHCTFWGAASAVLITCPTEPWVNARSRQWRGWCGHAQRSTSLVQIPELFQLTPTVIWSCALFMPPVLQNLAWCLTMGRPSCLILVICAYLFIYSYHGELDHLSVNSHHSSLLGFALLEVSLPAII